MSCADVAAVEAWLQAGLTHFRQGACSEAVACWYRVLDAMPEHARAQAYIHFVATLFWVDPRSADTGMAAPGAGEVEGRASPHARFSVDLDDPALGARATHPDDDFHIDWHVDEYEATASADEKDAEDHRDSPWDTHSTEGAAIDLDDAPTGHSLIEQLLRGQPLRVSDVESWTDAPGARAETSLQPSTASQPSLESDPIAQAADDDPAQWMEEAEQRFALGDFSGAEVRLRRVLARKPDDLEAQACLQSVQDTLLRMWESKLGDPRRAPRLLSTPSEVIWLNMHHRAGFLLAQIDGSLTYEDLVAVSGMSRFETFRILADLLQSGVIA